MGCMWRIWARNKCLRCTTRSSTSPREAADCDAVESGAGVVCAGAPPEGASCERAGTTAAATSRNAKINECRIRIGIIIKKLCYLFLCYPKDHVQYHSRV